MLFDQHGRGADRVEFIAGACSEFGTAQMRQLAEEGATLVLAEKNEEAGKRGLGRRQA